jgi:trigger factor
MKYTHKDLPGSVKHLEINLSGDEFAKYWQISYDKAIKEVNVKGFRKGSAPKEIADKAINKDEVFSGASVDAVREILKQITEEKDWEVVDQPKIDIKEKGKDFIFKIDLTVFPEVSLKDYKKIAKKIFSDKKESSVSEKEIQEAVDWILNSRAKIVLSSKPAEIGNVVNIDYKGKNDQFILGQSKIEKDFDKKIVGHKDGEEFDGIKLNSVFNRQIPELNDEFVQTLGEFKTIDDLKKSINEGISKEKELKEVEKLRIKILEEIIKNSKIEIPQIMIDKTLAGMLEEYKIYVKQDFKEDDVKKKLEPEAKKKVASNLILYKIAKLEKLEPEPEEVEIESSKILGSLRPEEAAKIDKERIHNYSYDILKNKKVFEFLESCQ